MKEKNVKKLVKLIEKSRNSNFYRERLKGIELNETNIIKNFKKIPILNKDEIIGKENQLLTQEYDSNFIIKEYTSGTTGKAMACYLSKKDRLYKAYQLWKTRRNFCEISPMDKRALFSPYYVFQGEDKICFDEEDNDLYLSNINMTDDDMKDYYEALIKFKPVWLTSVPSALYMFASFLLKENLDGKAIGVKMIEVNGEMLFDYQKNTIEKAFGNILYNHYGSRETWCLGYSCDCNELHIFEDDFVYELVNLDSDGVGELVITDLNNFVWPIIRYNVGDKVRISNEKCNCGFNTPKIEVIGGRKQEDFEIDGWIGNSVIFHYAVSKINAMHGTIIKQYQIIQNDYNDFSLNIVINDNFKDSQGYLLVNDITSKIPVDVKIKLNIVPFINNDGNKFKYYKRKDVTEVW